MHRLIRFTSNEEAEEFSYVLKALDWDYHILELSEGVEVWLVEIDPSPVNLNCYRALKNRKVFIECTKCE